MEIKLDKHSEAITDFYLCHQVCDGAVRHLYEINPERSSTYYLSLRISCCVFHVIQFTLKYNPKPQHLL